MFHISVSWDIDINKILKEQVDDMQKPSLSERAPLVPMSIKTPKKWYLPQPSEFTDKKYIPKLQRGLPARRPHQKVTNINPYIDHQETTDTEDIFVDVFMKGRNHR